MFSISLVSLDSYQAPPIPDLDVTFSDFRGTEIRQVPVVRIFGSTSTGSKTCLHVHGAFPYMYVPCTIEKDADSFAYRLAAALDTAINVSLGSAMSNNQHVYRIQRVSGVPIYGFHKRNHLFFKIYFYNPAIVKRAADLLQNGTVLNQSLQPHEAHIPFILQFMIDYNLYGMSVINLSSVMHRRHALIGSKENSQAEESLNLTDTQKYLPAYVARQSMCELEVDAQAPDILNGEEISKGLDLNPGIAAIWNDERVRRDEKGLPHSDSQLLYSQSQNREFCLQTDSDLYQESRLLRRLQVISQTDESTTSSLTPSASSYPLEVEGDDDSVNASHVLNNFQPSLSSEESKRKKLAEAQFVISEESILPGSNQSIKESADSTLLDGEDMRLLEILDDLAEENEVEKIMDNDSVLGSQYSILSDRVEDEKEEDEVEDLNITSLDLDSLTSWNSMSKPSSQTDKPETETEKNKNGNNVGSSNILGNVEDISIFRLPQYDGGNDSPTKDTDSPSTKSLETDETEGQSRVKAFGKQTREFKSKRRKDTSVAKKDGTLSSLMYDEKMMEVCNLEHRDLDVYDIDDAEGPSSTNKDTNLKRVIGREKITSKEQESNKFIGKEVSTELKAVVSDGETIKNSSDSEVEQDVTINREERRICAYGSATKSTQKKQRNLVNVTSQKRKCTDEILNPQSPYKRRHVDTIEEQKHLYDSPSKSDVQRKSRVPRSPRNLSGKYSPLKITVTSPRVNRSVVQKDGSLSVPSSPKSSITSGCDTPKRQSQALRIGLLRERSCLFPKANDVNSDGANGDKEGLDSVHRKTSQKDPQNSVATGSLTDSASKIYKEVRKRLSFVNVDEKESSPVETATDERHYENLPLAECIANRSSEDCLIGGPIVKSDGQRTSTSISDGKNENINGDESLTRASTSKVDTYVEDLEKEIINEDDGLCLDQEEEEEEENANICNVTFTQYISKKLESDINVSVQDESIVKIGETRSVIITTRFNPPSRQRIVDSMKMYDIPECRAQRPFFSNKLDLIKHKESTKDNTIPDLLSFKSSLDGVTGIRLWRRMKVNEFHPSGASIKTKNMKRALAGYNSLMIRPLIQPPSRKDVKNWLLAKEYLSRKNEKAAKSKKMQDCAGRELEEKKIEKQGESCAGRSTETELLDRTKLDAQSSLVEVSAVDETFSKKDSQNSNSLGHSSTSSGSLNPSLQKILENSQLYKHNRTEHQLGISYGQIEYSMKVKSRDVANENLQNARTVAVYQYLTLLSVEVHVITRGDLLPDPEHDCIAALFYAIHNDVPASSHIEQMIHGAVIVDPTFHNSKWSTIHSTSTMCPISYVKSEEDLLNSLVTLIKHCDPDILLGWELEALSWGFVFQRASRLGFNNFTWQISKIPNMAPQAGGQSSDKDNFNDAKVPGRIILDVWRIMRHEAALLNYTFENVMYHIMHERISCPTFKTLTDWWKQSNLVIRWRVISHYVVRVLGTLKVLIHLDVIGRTCEHARLFGIQFYEVFSRGSQFRVESMMLRLAKPLNYIPVSPSIQQRARMRAPESLPLIMEPQSTLYTDPLIVLDFQSLYPSIIIAYNYCFSTCLGRVEHIGQNEPFDFGATTLRIKKSTALRLQGKINFAPCGVAYVKQEVRQGILPRMLTEILNTRLMVKGSMKLHGNENRVLQRVLHSQQLGLKLIANVTYGYTAANFSGRMPCIEVGDSVVSKGRETLERAIKIVESTPKWGAQVVYGDTDSLFVLLPGKSRKEAFVIGAEIADTVTAANPPPVKLKFEKILQPSILQTKKRYCGYMYETPEQKEPEYLAKGIETVRRDGCPAVSKILEKSLKILFDTKDVSLVKLYVTRQFDKILRRRISIEDLTFAKEFRGLNGYKASACVPALELTRRLMRKDPRAIPRTSERVRYVIVAGAPNQALIHCVRTPMEVISDEGLIPNSVYYITKVVIPPLNRCLNLIGVDVNIWYREMSHRQTPDKAASLFTDNQKSTIRQFFPTTVCATCGELTKKEICADCLARPSQSITILHEKVRMFERTYHQLISICQSCTGYSDEPKCESLDCPVLYRVAQARRDLIQIPYLSNIINNGNN